MRKIDRVGRVIARVAAGASARFQFTQKAGVRIPRLGPDETGRVEPVEKGKGGQKNGSEPARAQKQGPPDEKQGPQRIRKEKVAGAAGIRRRTSESGEKEQNPSRPRPPISTFLSTGFPAGVFSKV